MLAMHTAPMSTLTRSSARGHWLMMALGLAFVVAAMSLGPSRLVGADASPQPSPDSSPAAAMTPADVGCDSLDDLRLIVEFLQGTDVGEEGWLPVFVGVVAGLSEARQLADALGETYRPLVDDLIAALEGLAAAVSALRESETIGSGIAAVGGAITDVGNAMDALSVQMRTPCPA